jgi:hypothetical protein
MSIVTVPPDYPFLAFGGNAVRACMKRFPDDTRLWLDYGVGKQFCAWIESVLKNGGAFLLGETDVRAHVYPVQVRTRKSFGLMTRKLSVTESRKLPQFLGTLSRKKSSVASANCPHVA